MGSGLTLRAPRKDGVSRETKHPPSSPRNRPARLPSGSDRADRPGQLLATADGYFTGLTAGPGPGVYATSGANGKVYLLTPDRAVQTAIDVPERQALTLIFAKDEALLGTGDAAALYRVATTPKDPIYTTKVFDALYAARWGQVRVTTKGTLKIETRSGNASKPDKTWSPWAALGLPQKLPHGSAAKVLSPNGRYVQARVIFGPVAYDRFHNAPAGFGPPGPFNYDFVR